MFEKFKMLAQARELQNKMKNLTCDIESNGLQITINGKQEILNLIIVDESLLQKKDRLENAIKNAINDAISRSQREIAMKMQGDLGSLLNM